jgi:putative flippase GtrA
MNALRRPAAFVIVGCAAAAVHWSLAVALVEWVALSPQAANVAAWLGAWGVSFSGHRLWTFGDRRGPVLGAATRFFALSGAGFVLNVLAYAALLRWTALRYDLALACVLLMVASATYVASHWAFRAA